MKMCPLCKHTTANYLSYGVTVIACYHCYSIGFGPGRLSKLLGVDESRYLNENHGLLKVSSPKCFYCGSVTRIFSLKRKEKEHLENLRLFQNWKYWFDYHRKGHVEVIHCPKCRSAWMNSRTLCQFEINWEQIEIQYRQAQHAEENSGIRLSLDDPFSFIMGMVLGIPQLANIPSVSELPMATYLVAFLVGVFTSKGLRDTDILHQYSLSTNLADSTNYMTLISYSFFHETRGQFFGSILFFLAFSPMVEHELSLAHFTLFIFGTIAAVGFVQFIIFPGSIVGFSGVTAAILTFFCLRFPSSMIGFGIFRFSAPVALALFLFFNSHAVLSSLQGNGPPAQITGLSGALFGYLFHLILPKGKSTEAFQKLHEARVKQEKEMRNWRGR